MADGVFSADHFQVGRGGSICFLDDDGYLHQISKEESFAFYRQLTLVYTSLLTGQVKGAVQ